MTSIIEDILKKIGLTERQTKWIAYVADSIYWVILFYLIMNNVYIANEMCLQAAYHINTQCNVMCSDRLQSNQYLNDSIFEISWLNTSNSGGFPYGD